MSIKAFNRHRINAHGCSTKQQCTHVEVNLFLHPVLSIVQVFTVQVYKVATRAMHAGFGFFIRKTAIFIFVVQQREQIRVINAGFGAEHHHVRGI
ncbi:Uncharacterised protein [Vibrio cholerae]|nr:Uncharacterised protein [Vibrio cholerae]